jgi:hypothetical protein
MVGGHFQWGKFISSIMPDDVSGFDMVLRSKGGGGDVVTFHVKKGEVFFQSMGDTAGHRYKEFKYVVADVVISGSDTFTAEFYPEQEFMDSRTTESPWKLAVGARLLILLCTLLFVFYDVSMRNKVNRTEIVLGTKRRFVRFISHEMRTPLNTIGRWPQEHR